MCNSFEDPEDPVKDFPEHSEDSEPVSFDRDFWPRESSPEDFCEEGI